MKITNEAALKLIKDIQLMEDCDDLFTAALTALETYNYGIAYTLAKKVVKSSKDIEQRCGAMMVCNVASQYDKDNVDLFLNTIYRNL